MRWFVAGPGGADAGARCVWPAAALLLSGCVPVLHSPGGAADACAAWEAPENTWYQGEVPEGTCAEGWAEGDVIEDAREVDQLGDEVSLWQFYGDVVLLDVSTLWCSPCQDLARGAQAIADEYRDQGFVYLTVLTENVDLQPPTQDDLNSWGDAFGITEPIVDDSANIRPSLMPDPVNYPGVFVIGRDLTIGPRDLTPSDETIRAEIEAAL